MYYDISKNQIIFKLTNSKPTEQAERCQTLVANIIQYNNVLNMKIINYELRFNGFRADKSSAKA